MMAKIIVTGAAGFIGAALSRKLLELGHEVIGLDNLSDYYDVGLKQARLEKFLIPNKGFRYVHGDIADKQFVDSLVNDVVTSVIVNLAPQSGVRYSLVNPHVYIDSNVTGFLNILEA